MTTETVFPSARDLPEKECSGEDLGFGAAMPVRSDWLFSLTAACQRLAGATLEADRGRFLQAFENLARDLPVATSGVERLVLYQSAVWSFVRAGHQFHRDFHARVWPGDCPVAPTERVAGIWKGSVEHPPDVRQWAGEFLVAFDRDHQWPVAARAAALLRARCALPLDVPSIARQVGCSKTTLMKAFSDAFAMTMTEYIRRLRIRRSIAGLRDRESKVAAIARSGMRARRISIAHWNKPPG
jgi:AraC-like DNA-binding protein